MLALADCNGRTRTRRKEDWLVKSVQEGTLCFLFVFNLLLSRWSGRSSDWFLCIIVDICVSLFDDSSRVNRNFLLALCSLRARVWFITIYVHVLDSWKCSVTECTVDMWWTGGHRFNYAEVRLVPARVDITETSTSQVSTGQVRGAVELVSCVPHEWRVHDGRMHLGVLGVTHTTHESCQHASQKKKEKKIGGFNRPPVKQHLVIEWIARECPISAPQD